MIFLDTSAIYAWADAADPNHAVAVRSLQAILESGEDLLTHNYVLVESVALLQARLGLLAANKLGRDAANFAVEWVDAELHAAAIHALDRPRPTPSESCGSRQLSGHAAPEGIDGVCVRSGLHLGRLSTVRRMTISRAATCDGNNDPCHPASPGGSARRRRARMCRPALPPGARSRKECEGTPLRGR